MANAVDEVLNELNTLGITEQKLVSPIRDLVIEICEHDSWKGLERNELKELLLKSITYYGITNLESLVPLVMPIYEQAIEVLSSQDRLDLEAEIRARMEDRVVSVNALMPFMYVDDNHTVVSSATIDLAMIPSPMDNNPIYWPQRILNDLVRGLGRCKGGILGGLICLGDQRINELIEIERDGLADDDVQVAAKCNTAWSSLGAFEFWLGWGESLAERGQSETARFGHVMSALVLLIRAAKDGVFVSAQRNFGYLFNDSTDLKAMEFLGEYTFEDLLEQYQDRLVRIAELEQNPKIALDVLRALKREPILPAN